MALKKGFTTSLYIEKAKREAETWKVPDRANLANPRGLSSA